MKILIINYEFPPLGGGGGNATRNIAKKLTLLGEDIIILTTWLKGLKEIEKNDGYTIIRVKSLRRKPSGSNPLEMLSFVYEAIKRAPSIINEFKPDKVLAFFAIPSGIVAYYIKKRYDIPYIISLHGGDVPGHMSTQLKHYHFFTKGIFRLICKNAIAITAVSDYLKNLAEKNFSKKVKIFVTKNGICADEFRPDAAQKENSIIKIIFVGRFSKEKQIDLLIKSFRSVKSKFPQKKILLELVGDGVLRKDLESLAKKLKINNDILFSGWQNKSVLIKKYQSSEIFILPSSEETFSITVLEAMASGLPIIANKAVASNAELIKNGINGILFEQTENNLTEAICKLVANKIIRQEYGKASLRLSKNYSWNKTAQKYQKLLKNNMGYFKHR